MINPQFSFNELAEAVTPKFDTGFFECRTANQCLQDARSQPIPRKLFLSLFYENELTILVADTGVGKSIFAVQIANEIAQNEKVLYLDLELSDKQFQGRYSENYQDEYSFSPNLYRTTFKRRFEMPEGVNYEDYFIDKLKALLQNTGAKIVIIDNMTRLISSDTDQAKNAKPLMDSLNDLKFDFGLSMLLLEHTKKVDTSRPIHLNDLQGSKMKANFADAVFTIGRSAKDKNLRYVKQLKVRSSEVEYDTENVLLYEVVKENSFLQFKFIGYDNELAHLRQPSDEDKAGLKEKVIELKSQGKSLRDIGTALGISKNKVDRILKS
jgi:KaiC/GvpD/RAD55 family RecA-like ATPase